MRPRGESEHCWEAALDGDLRPAVVAHLASCAACAARVEEVQRAAVAVQAEIPPPPPGLDVRVLASLERERHGAARRWRPRLPRLRPLGLVAAVTAALLLVALIVIRPAHLTGGSSEAVPIEPLPAQCSGGSRLVVAGVWAGHEADEFARVLGLFQERTGIQVIYAYETHDIATKIESLVKQGCAPDVALLPQPGTMSDLARRGVLRPLDAVAGDLVRRYYSPAWRALGSVDGHLYGVWFKGAAKSIIWYRPSTFARAGIARPPRSWSELLSDAVRLRAAGIQPFAVAGADGWTLTDWFENVYLTTAGPARYQALAENRIKWTDPTVKHALHVLAAVLGDRALSGPLALSSHTTFAASVAEVFGPRPRAAMVFEGDFVRSFLPSSLPSGGARFFAFPAPAPQAQAASEVGGDVAVLFSRSSAAGALIRFLAEPQAAAIWVRGGGFISPNRGIPARDYGDPLTRQLARRLVRASAVRFDLSDQEPPAFGSDAYQGMWKLFQQFLARPGDVDHLAASLQAGATAAAACEKAVGGAC